LIVARLVTILALSVAAPGFAPRKTLLERSTYTSGTPLDAMAYASVHSPAATAAVRDLATSSQR